MTLEQMTRRLTGLTAGLVGQPVADVLPRLQAALDVLYADVMAECRDDFYYDDTGRAILGIIAYEIRPGVISCRYRVSEQSLNRDALKGWRDVQALFQRLK